MFFQNTLIRFRVGPLVCPAYAHIVFKSWVENGTFAKIARQTTSIAHLGADRFANMLFPLRDSSEQRLVADIIGAADDQIRLAQATVEKRAVIEQAVSYFLPDLPYERLPLGEIATVSAGLTLGSEPSGASSVALPYLRVANVQDGHIDTSGLKMVRVPRTDVQRYALRNGDLLLTEGGDFDKLGRGAVWDGRIEPCLHQNHIFRVRCRPDLVIPDYLAIYTASPLGRRYFLSVAKQTTNLASINSTQLRAMPVRSPGQRVRYASGSGAAPRRCAPLRGRRARIRRGPELGAELLPRHSVRRSRPVHLRREGPPPDRRSSESDRHRTARPPDRDYCRQLPGTSPGGVRLFDRYEYLLIS